MEPVSRTLIALLALWVAQVSSDPAPATGTKCSPVSDKPGCVCDLPQNGGRIDLTGMANNNGQPKFTDLTDTDGFKYSYNPCYTFNSNDLCSSGVFVCQISPGGVLHYEAIATGTEEIWVEDSGALAGTPYLYYTGPGDRDTRVYLNCDPSTSTPDVSTTGDTVQTLSYVIYIKSASVCPSGGGGGGGESIAGPVGLALIFIMLGALIAYFIIGAVVMKFKFEKTGTEIVPNKAFWLTIPFLIKDGFVFTFSPCVNLVRGRKDYQSF